MIFPSNVYVLDTSVLIQLKRIVSIEHQWTFFRCLEQMVRDGQLFICRQVVNESKVKHPDLPGAWAHGVGRYVARHYRTSPARLRMVMAEVPDVVVNDEEAEADPHVIAQALELRAEGLRPIVVTRDESDEQGRMALTRACAQFDIHTVNEYGFIDTIDCDAGQLVKPTN